MNNSINNRSKRNNQYIIILFILVMFYPTKGLLNLAFLVFIGDSSAFFFNKIYFIFLFSVLIVFTLFKGISDNKRNRLHIMITLFVSCLAIQSLDYELNRIVILLFVLPLLFQLFDGVGVDVFNKVLKSLFIFTLFYMAFEQIILHIRIDGDLFVSQNSYANYYKIISTSGEIIDERHNSSNVVRSGGYLADPLAMPVIVTMAATYFYLYFKIYNRYFFFSILGAYLVISSLSTTSIIAYAVSILIIETYYRKYLLIKLFFLIFLLYLTTFHPYYEFLINRVKINFSNEKYMNVYFDYSNMISLHALQSFLLGEWVWYTNNVSSHLDIFLVANSMGILIAVYILYKIFLKGIVLHAKRRNIYSIYSFMLLIPFISLYHHAMTFNLNVFIVVILISNKVSNYNLK